MPFPLWNPPRPDPTKPWTLPRPGDERRVPPPSERAWWSAIESGDVARVSAWLAGPDRFVHEDPRTALLKATNKIGQTALGWLLEEERWAEAALRLLPVLLVADNNPLLPGVHTVFTRLAPFWVALQHPDERVARAMWDSLDRHGDHWVSKPSWLYAAVSQGCERVVLDRLLAWGVSMDGNTPLVNERTPSGETALFAVFRHWPIAKPLLDPLLAAHADPRIRNRDGLSPIGYVKHRLANQSSMAPALERLEMLARWMDERDALNKALAEVRPALAPQDPAHEAAPAAPRRRL